MSLNPSTSSGRAASQDENAASLQTTLLAAITDEWRARFSHELEQNSPNFYQLDVDRRHQVVEAVLNALLSDTTHPTLLVSGLQAIINYRVLDRPFDPALQQKARARYVSLVEQGHLENISDLYFAVKKICAAQLLTGEQVARAFCVGVPRVLADDKKWQTALSLLKDCDDTLGAERVLMLRRDQGVRDALLARFHTEASNLCAQEAQKFGWIREALELCDMDEYLSSSETHLRLQADFKSAFSEARLSHALCLIELLPRSPDYRKWKEQARQAREGDDWRASRAASELVTMAEQNPHDLLSDQANTLLDGLRPEAKLALMTAIESGWPGIRKEALTRFCNFFIDENFQRDALYHSAVRKGLLAGISHLPDMYGLDGVLEMVPPSERLAVFGDGEFGRSLSQALNGRLAIISEFNRRIPHDGVLEDHFRSALSKQAQDLMDREDELHRLYAQIGYAIGDPVLLYRAAHSEMRFWVSNGAYPRRFREDELPAARTEWWRLVDVTRKLITETGPSCTSVAYLIAVQLDSIAYTNLGDAGEVGSQAYMSYHERRAVSAELLAATETDEKERARCLQFAQTERARCVARLVNYEQRRPTSPPSDS